MVSECVAALSDAFGKRRKSADALTDLKKSRACTVPLQQVEQLRRDGRIRAVVKGERQGSGGAGAANCISKEL
jgi:hypothetical protein